MPFRNARCGFEMYGAGGQKPLCSNRSRSITNASQTPPPTPTRSNTPSPNSWTGRRRSSTALVAKNERLIGLLHEKRTALITRAVTRGLDLNAPVKDSGIPWLGEIPAHWEVKRLGHLTPSNRRIM